MNKTEPTASTKRSVLSRSAQLAVPTLLLATCMACFVKWGPLDAVSVLATIALLAGILGIFARGNWRTVALNTTFVLAIATVVELYFAIGELRQPPRPSVSYQVPGVRDPRREGYSYFASHPLLGYGPRRNVVANAWLTSQGVTSYRTRYTIDDRGIRAHPSSRRRAERAVLFFGGSYMFGEGVSDSESLPAVFEARDQAGRKALNLGFHGYGPEHMLAMLQNRIELSVLEGSKPDFAVCLVIPHDVIRVTGRMFWDVQGNSPRYELAAPDELRRTAPISKETFARWRDWATTSRTIGRVLETTRLRTTPDLATAREWQLLVEIIARSSRIFEERYGGQFIALLTDDIYGSHWWSRPYPVADALKAKGVRVIRLEEIAPLFTSDPSLMNPPPGDDHPSARAFANIGEALADRLKTHL